VYPLIILIVYVIVTGGILWSGFFGRLPTTYSNILTKLQPSVQLVHLSTAILNQQHNFNKTASRCSKYHLFLTSKYKQKPFHSH